MIDDMVSFLAVLALCSILYFAYISFDHWHLREEIRGLEGRINRVAPSFPYQTKNAKVWLEESKQRMTTQSRLRQTEWGPWLALTRGKACMDHFDRWLKETGGRGPDWYV